MALIFTGTTAAGVTVTGTGNLWITLAQDSVAGPLDAFDFGSLSANDFVLNGDLYAGRDGIVSAAGAKDLGVTIGAGASVTVSYSGVSLGANQKTDQYLNVVNLGAISADFHGVVVQGRSSSLLNTGTIAAVNGTGALFFGDLDQVINHGTIAGNQAGIEINGNNANLVNTGLVTGQTAGLRVIGNGGVIETTGTVIASYQGILYSGISGYIHNGGTISANVGISVQPGLLATNRISNDGTITGAAIGIDVTGTGNAVTLITNSGTISAPDQTADAAIRCSIGIDRIRNSGLIDGKIDLGGNDDLYNGANGTVTGDILAGDGNDRVFGGDENNIIDGGTGLDVLSGSGGDDSLFGGSDDDTIRGGTGDDSIFGGNGKDSIDGGTGDDLLVGGTGKDVFVFKPAAGYDVVLFVDTEDRIDLSAFSVAGFAALSAAITTAGSDAFIDWSAFGGTGVARILNAAGVLDSSDFIF